MAKETINLNKAVEEGIHVPRNKETGDVAYIRIDGIDEGVDTKSIVCSSPNNIRRVFITHNKVVVHLFRGFNGINRGKILSKAMPLDMGVVANARANGTWVDKYNIIQTGLGALTNKWVASNIEEVYFDYSILLSPMLSEIMGVDLFQRFVMNRCMDTNGSWVFEMFTRVCCKGIGDISKRFPRLRCIAYISGLSELACDDIPAQLQGGGQNGLDIDSLKLTWFDVKTDSIKSLLASKQNQSLAVWRNKKLYGRPMTDYAGRDGLYLFDKIVLEGYFSRLAERIKESARELNGTKVSKNTGDNTISTPSKEEELFNSVYNESGDIGVMGLFKVMTDGVPKSEWIKMLNSMSNEKQELYKGILGLK